MSPLATTSAIAAFVAAIALTPGAAARVQTTEPQNVYTNNVTLSDQKMTLAFTRVERGALVIFRLRNVGKHARDFQVASIKGPIVPPGKTARFEVNFIDRADFLFTSSGVKVKTLSGKFTVY